ncbi:hypothetical protein ACFONL_16620 [Camelimonas fluminis]|uniref:Uncharacterized protein n=1 Tax=Camelimonas fluminis TaxID=1576911 RepID=A0ABV7UJT7_9HYPH|nr:hypothetical protein [Camelimonas fluminis]
MVALDCKAFAPGYVFVADIIEHFPAQATRWRQEMDANGRQDAACRWMYERLWRLEERMASGRHGRSGIDLNY